MAGQEKKVPGTAASSKWWPRWSVPLLIVLIGCSVVIRAGSGFGYVALFQIIFVLPWLAPILFITAFVKRQGQACTDTTLRRLLLTGMLALPVAALVGEMHPYEECLLFTCRAQSSDPVWWSDLEWLFRVETALIPSAALLVISIMALSRSPRTSPLGDLR